MPFRTNYIYSDLYNYIQLEIAGRRGFKRALIAGLDVNITKLSMLWITFAKYYLCLDDFNPKQYFFHQESP